MKAALLPTLCIVALFAASQAPAGDAKIVTFTDEAAEIAGLTVISDYDGPLPPIDPGTRGFPQMPGFPTSMGGDVYFSPTRGLVFGDLNGDDYLEIITSSTDNYIYAWDYTGTPMPGFPVRTIEKPQYAPSVGDLDGDGDLEIVQFTRGLTSGGRLYVLDHQGTVLPGFPKSVNNNNLTSCPTLYDLDGDGNLEIIVPERAYPIGYLHIFEIDATEWGGGWPVALDHVPTCTAGVGDVDDDGAVEVVYMSYDSIYVIDLDGSIAPGWPQQLPNAQFSYQSPALADLDGDGDLEIAVGAHGNSPGCYVFHHDGTYYPGWPRYYQTWSYCPPTVTDLEGDGVLEILGGQAGYMSGSSNCFWAWSSTGTVKPGFPYRSAHGGGSDGPLTVADINGDGEVEIFADHNMMVGDEGFLFGVDSAGNDLPGFPIRTRGFTYMNGATIGDVDGDGDYELGVLSYHDAGVDVNLYDLSDRYSPTSRDWPVYHGRNERGGRYPVAVAIAGDIDGDGDVDLADLATMLAAYDTCDGDPGYNPDADLDDSGCIDLADLATLLANYGVGT